MADPPKTVGGIVDAGAEYLRGRGVDEPRLAAELLAARLLRCRRLELPLRRGEEMAGPLVAAMRRGVGRVGAGEPVQYVIGETEFMGHRFRVDRRALIPRPETESLVERVLSRDELWRGTPAVVDIGTGTGCILVSLALARPRAHYIGLDASAEAVALAEENAQALGVADRVAFAAAELSDTVDPGTLDAVVSNPPYVPTPEYERLPAHIREHEPRLALDGGPDGLDVIRAVVGDAAIVLKPGGCLFLEIGEAQAGAVARLMGDEGFSQIGIARDLAGRDRVAHAVLAGGEA